ncbi:MAG: metallophosphoesterase [Desulfobacteraceae bacterium]|nr:MAG: metallophosphoesterase [Desulfobacteraceae bacterium]
MKLAVFSDVHGNQEAFQKVLADAESLGLHDMICLGDCIGYGPEPEAVIEEVRRRKIPAIIGNHEMAVIDRIHLNWFNLKARESLEKTLTMLSAASMAFIKALPYSRVMSGARFVHGYPPESAQTYLFQKAAPELRKTFQAMPESICFVGHTHHLEMIRFDGRQVERRPLQEGTTPLDPNCRYMVNVGSVGQPRDGNNHAKYVIWNQDPASIEVRFISYDIAGTVAKILAAGLPEVHANRLW